jgi:hypothetical protein
MKIEDAITLPVGELLSLALFRGRAQNRDLSETWVKQSFALGGLLPTSMLMVSIQRAGDFDLLLRSMEEEQRTRLADAEDPLLTFNTHSTYAELWVGMIYEIVRLLLDRSLIQSEGAVSLGHDLRLVRVPLEKHEVPQDRKLEGPLEFVREPRNGDASDLSVYDKSDPARSHILPRGVSDRGSLVWHVIDVVAKREYWVERRDLSDRFLALERDN